MRHIEEGAGLAQIRVEIAAARWAIAQELNCWSYPEQDEDAQMLEAHFGQLPE